MRPAAPTLRKSGGSEPLLPQPPAFVKKENAMPQILLAECMQEISSFNPRPSDYGYFRIQRGDELYRQRSLNSAIGGALGVFATRPDIETLPTYAARSASAGLLSAAGWQRLSGEFLEAVATKIDQADALYISLHGAMAAEGELDPEGFLLEEVRAMAGPARPIVISLDLHGILTDRMLRQIDGLAIYHTYPHVDFADTGERAARLLLAIIDREPRTHHRPGGDPGPRARRRTDHPHRLLRRPNP